MPPVDSQTPTSERYVATSRHVSCTVSGEVVILHLDDGAYYGLNEVGTRLWELLQQPLTLDGAVEQLVSEFEVETDECTRDVRELLGEFERRGLIEVVGA